MKLLLTKHPNNASLKKWCKRFRSALDSTKKKGYSVEFEALWKLYDYRTGSKSDAYGSYCKLVDDHEVVMVAVRLYKADIKKQDVTQAHLVTWLNQRRWESYDGIQEKVEQKRICQVCKEQQATTRISYVGVLDGKRHPFGCATCPDCEKYDGQTYDINLKQWID
jgi:hypothetical protein